jgi:hypothetical protein
MLAGLALALPGSALAYGESLYPLLGASTGDSLYVSTMGDDANPGSFDLPFRTIQRGIDRATCGATVYVRGGDYVQSLRVLTRICGPGVAPITVGSYMGETAVLHGSGDYILRVSYGSEGWRFGRSATTGGLYFFGDTGTPQGNGRPLVWVSDATGGGQSAKRIEFNGDVFDWNHLDGTCTLFSPNTDRVDLIGNAVRECGSGSTQRQGIYHQGGRMQVLNNVVYDIPNGFGLQLQDRCADGIAANNTVVDIGVQRGIYVNNNCRGMRIRNNVSAYSGQQELYGLKTSGSCPPSSSNRAFTNLAWDARGPWTGNTAGCAILDFTDGQGDYVGPGQNTIADPLFIDRAVRDYHLLAGSPAIDAGADAYALPYDFDQNPRSGTSDLGAFEFQLPPPPPPPPPEPPPPPPPVPGTLTVFDGAAQVFYGEAESTIRITYPGGTIEVAAPGAVVVTLDPGEGVKR